MNYFDANTWTGRWPFAFCEAYTARTLASHLQRSGMRRALVSSLDAVFAPEPGPANRALLRETRGVVRLEPVPIINPALANWRDELALMAADPRVRAIRLLPNYHNFKLGENAVNDLIRAATAHRVRVIVQIRIIDERHEYHAMNLKAVPVGDLELLLARHPRQPLLASGLLRSEILPLVSKRPTLLADLSFAEWHDTIPHLLAKVSARQLVFASHTPLLITAAARAKLETSETSKAKLRAIAGENLERWLRR